MCLVGPNVHMSCKVSVPRLSVALVGKYTVVKSGQNPWLGWMEIYALDSLAPSEQLFLLRIVSCPSFGRPLSDHGAFALELFVGCLKASFSPDLYRTALSAAFGNSMGTNLDVQTHDGGISCESNVFRGVVAWIRCGLAGAAKGCRNFEC